MSIHTDPAADLRDIFSTTNESIVSLTDRLFECCRNSCLQLRWSANTLQARINEGVWQELASADFRKSAFRALVARVATLCRSECSESTPYGGACQLLVAGDRPILFQVKWKNTAAEQELTLEPRAAATEQAL